MNTPPGEREVQRLVGRKARRMVDARARRVRFAQELAHVGVLGWMIALPVVGLTALGRLIGDALGRPGLVFVGLALGLAAGGWAAWGVVRRSLRPRERGPEEGDG